MKTPRGIMTSMDPIGKNNNSPITGEKRLHRIRFVPNASAAQEVLLEFVDPLPQKAICVLPGYESLEKNAGTTPVDGIDVLTVVGPPADHLGGSEELLTWVAASTLPGTAPPIAITIHGAHVIWGGARAAILAGPDRMTSFLTALVDFSYHENELRKLEREVGEAWPLLEKDTPLAHAVTVPDPERFESAGQRLELTLKRRIRLARLEPHLYLSRRQLSPLANQLLERLREKALVEGRLEALQSQLEAFERICETTSQRISDYKAARQEQTLEWVIIVLLATETVLLLIELLWQMR
jgi:hypothetical protein